MKDENSNFDGSFEPTALASAILQLLKSFPNELKHALSCVYVSMSMNKQNRISTTDAAANPSGKKGIHLSLENKVQMIKKVKLV